MTLSKEVQAMLGPKMADHTLAEAQLNLQHNIRHLRTEKGWTQRELAEKAGLYHPAIVHLETNLTPVPTLTTLSKVAFALGVDIKDLLC